MMNLRCFAVHQFVCADNFAAKNLRDALMSQANTENRNPRPKIRESLRELIPAFSGRPGPGRNTNPVGLDFFDLIDRDLIVSLHRHVDAEHLAEKLDEIVGERIVIIDDQQSHCVDSGWRI